MNFASILLNEVTTHTTERREIQMLFTYMFTSRAEGMINTSSKRKLASAFRSVVVTLRGF